MRFHEKKKCPDKETDVRVRGRFHEALDHHFYHYYRHTHPERIMAICEEIERSIVVDDLTLTCFWEHLSLQDNMNTWPWMLQILINTFMLFCEEAFIFTEL